MDIIQSVEAGAVTVWDDIKGFIEKDVAPELTADASEILALVQPLLSSAATAVLQDIITFVSGVATSVGTGATIETIETAALNGLSALGGSLLAVVQGLAPGVLQVIVALVVARLKAAAAAVSGAS